MQPPIQWVLGALSLKVKRPGREAGHSPPNLCQGQENVDLYICSSIHLHGTVLNFLSIGTTSFSYFHIHTEICFPA
jgi:hypothetical protein